MMRTTFRTKSSDYTGVWFLLMIIFSMLLTAFGIWAIVEFILYLVKDTPFNWTSLVLAIIAFVGEIACFIKFAVSDP